jgi:hypothetical protein
MDAGETIILLIKLVEAIVVLALLYLISHVVLSFVVSMI